MFAARTKRYRFACLATLAMATLAACQSEPVSQAHVLRVGASAVPHEAMLRHIQPLLAESGISLQTVAMQDYVQPNLRVASGDLDANFFQTVAYFEDFCRQRGLDLANAGEVHVEPFALYSRKHQRLEDVPQRGKVAVPSDVSNQHRALMLLAQTGLVTLRHEGGKLVSTRDVLNNPRQLQFLAVEAAMLPRMLEDVDVAGINANFALAAKLRPDTDGLLIENAHGTPYANIVAVRAQDAQRPAVLQLMAALRSEAMRAFIDAQYQGAVAASF